MLLVAVDSNSLSILRSGRTLRFYQSPLAVAYDFVFEEIK